MTIGASITTIISVIATGLYFISGEIVWASEYQRERAEDQEFLIQMRIDILEDRRARSKDSELRQRLNRKIERYQKQLEKLDARKLEKE